VTSTLQSVAAGCWNGASNPVGLLNALSEAMRLRLGPFTAADKLDLRIIVDHLDNILPPLSARDPVFDLATRYAAHPEAA
jgi:hypothetical protein